jgi:hypothetical protein
MEQPSNPSADYLTRKFISRCQCPGKNTKVFQLDNPFTRKQYCLVVRQMRGANRRSKVQYV